VACGATTREGCYAEAHANVSWSKTARAVCATAWIAIRTRPNHLCLVGVSVSETHFTQAVAGAAPSSSSSHNRGSKSMTGAQRPQKAEISAELEILSSERYHITSVLSIFTFKALHTCALTPT